MKKEICYILIGKKIGRFYFGRMVKKTIGNSTKVKFDGDWVLKREERKGDIVGFWHTHVLKEVTPSDRDIKTMAAWISCFYKPLLCIIQGFFQKQGFSVMYVEIKRTKKISVAWFPLLKIFKFCRFFGAVAQ